MNTCSSCARRPTGRSAPGGCSRGRSIWTSPVEGASISRKRVALTCGAWHRDQRREIGALTRSPFQSPRGVRGFGGRSVKQPKKLLRSPRAARKRARDSPASPKPATCRQARSRRRPDDREVVRRLPRSDGGDAVLRGGSRSRTPAGFLHGARRVVSEDGVFAAGAREQTSVVETDSKHLGGASKESRKASRGAHRQATGRRRARTGLTVILFAKGCNGSRRPQGRREPSVGASCKPVGRINRASAAGPPAVDRIRGRRAGSRYR
jgi:hypothetical protein